jgi:hypothetical protein
VSQRVPGGEAEADQDGALAVAEEARRARRLRAVVDLTMAVLRQGNLTRKEAESVVATARRAILDLFPDKESVYELVLAPRFRRALEEGHWPPPPVGRSTPFH